MDFVSSKFNYATHDGKMSVLYNSLSNALFRFNDIQVASSIVNNNVNNINEYLFKSLVNNGFLVTSVADEFKCAKMKRLNQIFSTDFLFQIMLTHQCNFNCTYCYEELDERVMSEESFANAYNRIYRNRYKMSSLSVEWFGGEPLLMHNQIMKFSTKLMRLANFMRIPYRASISTNAYLLSALVLRNLLSVNVFCFHVTLDGTREYHNQKRICDDGTGSFDTIMGNLSEIKEIKTRTFRIIIRVNLSKDMIHDIDYLMKHLEVNFAHDDRFLIYFRPIGDWCGETTGLAPDHNDFKKMLEEVLKSSRRLNYDFYYELLNQGFCPLRRKNSYRINVDGLTQKCILQSNGYSMDSDELELQYDWLIGTDTLSDKCGRCSLYGHCFGGACKISERKCGYENSDIDTVLKLISVKNVSSRYVVQH